VSEKAVHRSLLTSHEYKKFKIQITLMKIEECLADPGFEYWARQIEGPDYTRWQKWREDHPQYASLMDEAKVVLLMDLDTRKTTVPEREKQAEWAALARRLGFPGEPAIVSPRSRPRWWAAAALVLLALGWWAFFQNQPVSTITFSTGYGEVKELDLPDGSSVTLNANSQLSYPETWKPGEDRQVQLSGEAYFEVQSLPDQARFTVIAGPVSVEVLGTRFNVAARRQPVVSLLEGKVRLKQADSGASALLAPGQSGRFDPGKRSFAVFPLRSLEVISWKDHRWVFQATPLPEALQRIEDEFGLKSRLQDASLLEKRISGQVSTQDKQVLFKALEALLEVEIMERDGRLEWIKD